MRTRDWPPSDGPRTLGSWFRADAASSHVRSPRLRLCSGDFSGSDSSICWWSWSRTHVSMRTTCSSPGGALVPRSGGRAAGGAGHAARRASRNRSAARSHTGDPGRCPVARLMAPAVERAGSRSHRWVVGLARTVAPVAVAPPGSGAVGAVDSRAACRGGLRGTVDPQHHRGRGHHQRCLALADAGFPGPCDRGPCCSGRRDPRPSAGLDGGIVGDVVGRRVGRLPGPAGQPGNKRRGADRRVGRTGPRGRRGARRRAGHARHGHPTSGRPA